MNDLTINKLYVPGTALSVHLEYSEELSVVLVVTDNDTGQDNVVLALSSDSLKLLMLTLPWITPYFQQLVRHDNGYVSAQLELFE